MRDDISTLLVFVSRFLDYPNLTFFEECSNIDNYVNKNISSEELKKEVTQRLKPLFLLDLKNLQELYVETFDYKEKSGLYLTAQELGDSRKRGSALIQLQKLIIDLGFEQVSKELADYIPMLMELLAVAPENEDASFLKRRLAYAINRIYTHLPSGNLYHQVLGILMTFVFEAPNLEEIAQLENEREEADLEELPYPMLYR